MLSRAKDGRLFIADARALVGELKIHAATVDADLASVQDYADTTQQRRALDALAPQVARLIQTSTWLGRRCCKPRSRTASDTSQTSVST